AAHLVVVNNEQGAGFLVHTCPPNWRCAALAIREVRSACHSGKIRVSVQRQKEARDWCGPAGYPPVTSSRKANPCQGRKYTYRHNVTTSFLGGSTPARRMDLPVRPLLRTGRNAHPTRRRRTARFSP